jgi:hypothetical protein
MGNENVNPSRHESNSKHERMLDLQASEKEMQRGETSVRDLQFAQPSMQRVRVTP